MYLPSLRTFCFVLSSVFFLSTVSFFVKAQNVEVLGLGSQDSVSFQNTVDYQGEAEIALVTSLIREELEKKSYSEDDPVVAFYKELSFGPVWRSNSEWLSRAQQAFSILSEAERVGLRSSDYISPIFTGPELLDPKSIARADIALSKGLLSYISDVRFGRYNPKKSYGPKAKIKKSSDDTVLLLVSGLESESFGLWLERLGPPTRQYQMLLDALFDYEKIVIGGGWPLLMRGDVLREGDKSKRVPVLRKILMITGDLYLDKTAENSFSLSPPVVLASYDTKENEYDGEIKGNTGEGIGDHFFDKKLSEALSGFQKRHGLDVDGILGRESQSVLRVSAAERLDQIKINLERLRWDRSHQHSKYVRVNIPEYRLRAYKDGQEVLEMPVVVGKDERQTPILDDYIVNIKFNPDWTVPRSILERDILPKVLINPLYTFENNLETTYNGEVVDLATLDFSFADMSALKVRQLPGPSNPLGRFRFSLTNDLAIFLHDTPQKYLFGNTRRDNSSGCVRVGDAKAFAKFLIDDSEWNDSRLDEVTSVSEIKYLKFQEPVAVSLSYFTARVDDDGSINFHSDLYGRDLELMAKMI